jgi:hypothetical protein
MISTYVRLYVEHNIRHKSEFLYESKSFKRNMSLLSIMGTYLYFKYFSVRGKLKRNHKSMLNNSDLKTRNSKLYISKFKGRRISHMIYYAIKRPIVQEKLIVYSSLPVTII